MENSYGFFGRSDSGGQVRMPRGRNIAGYSVGILHLDDVWYPLLPGNVVNACTYDFPVRMRAVAGLDLLRLHSGDPSLAGPIIAAARELAERDGCRAISAACGFFGHFQSQVAEALNIPVALSSLVQVPWIQATLGRSRKIGVLSANASAMSDNLISNCGITNPEVLVVADLRHEPHFSAIMEGRGSFDNDQVRQEAVKAAKGLLKRDKNIGAILLECSDLPPYSAAIQQAVGLPVFDFITLIRWLHNATTQRPYQGYI